MDYKQDDWFKRLAKPEQQDISKVITTLDDWFNVRLAKPNNEFYSESDVRRAQEALKNARFFALYAVGSVITDKPNPADTDLLLVTNHFISNPYSEPRFSDLVAKLRETYEVDVDDQVSDRYDRETDCRIKIDLQRKDKSAKPVDIIYQYDVLSPEHWEANDKFPSVPIMRAGAENPCPEGAHGLMRVEHVPLDILRISEAAQRGYRY